MDFSKEIETLQAELIADVTALCLYHIKGLAQSEADRLTGIYNLVAAGECSWYDYARFVIARAEALCVPLKATVGQINPITTSEFPLPAPRPENSRLSTARLRESFGLHLPHWQVHVTRLLDELIGP